VNRPQEAAVTSDSGGGIPSTPNRSKAAGARTVNVRRSSGVQVGNRNTQINYTYNDMTWTDGVTPPPLVSVTGNIDSPYRGLRAFEEQDSAFFFGREEATDRLLERLALLALGPGLLVVSGASGAGKSSLLRAGLLPRIRGAGLGVAPGSAVWPCLVLTPGHAPLNELALRVAILAGADAAAVRRGLSSDPERFALTVRQAAAALPPRPGQRPAGKRQRRPSEPQGHQTQEAAPEERLNRRRLLLIIDQFEQVFTQCDDEREREGFIRAVCAAAGVGSAPGDTAPAMVVLGVRADFEARCADYPGLAEAIQDRYLVTAMTERELRMAVTEPAKMAGSRVDDDLVELLLADARVSQPGARAGALPLLSHALDQAWRSRRGEMLALPDYDRAGGIEGAVAASAQRAYERLTSSQQTMARQVFMRLTATSTDGSDTADRATRAELAQGRIPAETADVEAVLEAFAAERLLTLAADSVEISHEILLTAWPLLRDTWLAETHADRVVRTRLRNAAAEWARQSRDPSYLYSGTLLQAATSVAGLGTAGPAGNGSLSRTEHDFLQASDRARRRASRRRGAVIAGLLALIVAASAAAAVAVHNAASATAQAANAERQHAIALSRELAAESNSTAALDEPVIARQLAVAAWAVSPTSQAANAMASLIADQQQDSLIPAAPATTSNPETVAFSPGGHLLATGDDDGTLRLWNDTTRTPIRTMHIANPVPGMPDDVGAVAFSPNGQVLAAGGAGGQVDLWDPATGQLLQGLRPQNVMPTNVTGIEFSPSGRQLAISYASGLVLLSRVAGSQLIVIAADYKPEQLGGDLGVFGLSFSPDGKTLATADGNNLTRLWDTATGKPVGILGTSFGGFQGSVAFSPDGRLLATGDTNGVVELWNPTTRRAVAALGRGDGIGTGDVISVAFSPDGKFIAATDSSGKIQIWNTATNQLVLDHPTGSAAPGEVAFSPDSTLLAVTYGDGTVQLWDTGTMQPAGHSLQRSPSAGELNDIEFSPEGEILAGAAADGTIRLWNAASGALANTLRTTPADTSISSMMFSPEGHILASVEPDFAPPADGTVRLWNTATGKLIRSVENNVDAIAFSPNGKLLATGDGNGAIQLWSANTGQLTSTIQSADPKSGGVQDLAFSPNGKFLASDEANNENIRLWNTATGRLARAWSAGNASSSSLSVITFSPDSATLASGEASAGSTIRLWDTTTGRLIKTLPITDSGGLGEIYFSPDGKRLASVDGDGIVELWDALSGMEIGSPLGAAPPENDNNNNISRNIAFSPDSKILAATNADGTIQFWNSDNGHSIGGEFGQAAAQGSTSIVFNPNGSLLAEIPTNGPVQIWEVPPFTNLYSTLCADVGSPTPSTWRTYAAGEPEPAICQISDHDNA
jgi:WD40 repeat protein